MLSLMLQNIDNLHVLGMHFMTLAFQYGQFVVEKFTTADFISTMK